MLDSEKQAKAVATETTKATKQLVKAEISALAKEKINQIFVNKFELAEEELSEEKHLFNDLGLDSLDAVDLVIAFQSEFKIKPPAEELQAIRTLNDVYLLVARYAKGRV